MDNYVKGEVKQLDPEPVFQDIIVEGAIEMKVKAGSKIRNLMSFALKKFEEQTVKQIVWSGSGQQAVSKVITCVEMMKRTYKDLHQVNDIRYRRIEEYWEPKLSGLERLKVNKDVPMISIILSKDTLDPTLLGYQGPANILRDLSSAGRVGVGEGGKTGSEAHLKRKRKPKFRNVKKGNSDSNSNAQL